MISLSDWAGQSSTDYVSQRGGKVGSHSGTLVPWVQEMTVSHTMRRKLWQHQGWRWIAAANGMNMKDRER